jgi:hypothetical protein
LAKRANARGLTVRRRSSGLLAVTGWPDLNEFQRRLVQQVCDALWLPGAAGESEINTRAQAALEALRGIEPRNEREGMLAVQMVVTHSAAMDCLRRAATRCRPGGGRLLRVA